MKGLLKKDLIMLCKYGRITLFSCLLFTIAGGFANGNLFFALYPVAIGSVFAQSLLSYDERSGWDRYCDALPLSRAQIVTEKYLIALILFSVFFLLGLLSRVILLLRGGSASFLTAMAVMAAGGMLVPAVLLPFSFRFGTEKGRIVYLFAIGAVCAVSAAFSSGRSTETENAFVLDSGTAFGMQRISFAVFLISWRLSVVLYEKRELT